MGQELAIEKATGFASPALGYEDTSIDLNAYLVKQPAATYFFRLDSEDMADFGLHRGALLVVDRSKTPVINNLVVIRFEGTHLCRQIIFDEGYTFFSNGKSELSPTVDDTEIIGVVTASIQLY